MNDQSLIGGVEHSVDTGLGVTSVSQQTEIQGVRGRFHDLLKGHIVSAHTGRVSLDLQGFDPFPPDRNIRDTGNLHEGELHFPIGDHGKIHHVVLLQM